ncbi:hypothetical protein, partial [Acidiphilium sp.]|uniref:hypothetical protein n=1 Tax=Acidiphilium sp. TaxID=527 RepID=UPI00258AEA47
AGAIWNGCSAGPAETIQIVLPERPAPAENVALSGSCLVATRPKPTVHHRDATQKKGVISGI